MKIVPYTYPPGRPAYEYRDCVLLAFTVLTGKPYTEIHDIFEAHGRKYRHGVRWYTHRIVARGLGLKWRDCRMTVAKFCEDMQHVPVAAAFRRGHAFTVVHGKLIDAAPVRPKAIVIGYYVRTVK